MHAKILALTGGIATGKSTFLGLLADRFGARTFCADACVRNLLDGGTLAGKIREQFGPKACLPDGRADRAFLRGEVFSDPGKRAALERILHPDVRAEWRAIAQQCRESGGCFIADIPLLFETGAESAFDAVICIACSSSVRDARLSARPGISPALAQKMIASQMPADTKIARCDHVVWNDGPMDALDDQARTLCRLLTPTP